MGKFPFKTISCWSGGLFVLVLLRTVVTIGRCQYWGQDVRQGVLMDVWTYIGLAAGLFALLMLALAALLKERQQEQIEDTEE